MRELIIKWIQLDAQNFIPEVWYVVAIIWIGLVAIGIASVRGQTISSQAKGLWVLVIVVAPLIGLFAYCVFCLSKIDYYALDFLLLRRKKKKAVPSEPLGSA